MPRYKGFVRLLFGTSLALIRWSLQEKKQKYEGKKSVRAEAILLQLDMSHMRKQSRKRLLSKQG